MAKVMRSGPGWRLGYDPEAPFPVLVGGDTWAVELTAEEFSDFQRLCHQLTETVTAIAGELMPEENLNCELESERLWLEIDGTPQGYELRFILHQSRRAEGSWPPEVVPELLNAIHHLMGF